MFGKALNYLKHWLDPSFHPSPLHHIEQQDNNEHREINDVHTIAIKRQGSFLDSDSGDIFPSKRICRETERPTAGPVGQEVHPLQALPLDSRYFLKPDLRPMYPTMPRKSNPSTTNPMDSKSRGASSSSTRIPNHGKENNEIIEVSDEDDDICQAAHAHPSMKTKADGDCWVNAVPKHNPASKTFQRPCHIEKNTTLQSHFTGASKSSEFITGRIKCPLDSRRSVTTPRQYNRPAIGIPRTRIDNRSYRPLTASAIRGIEETFRLEDKKNYSELLQRYITGTQRVDGKPPSTGFQNTTKFDGIFDQPSMCVTLTKAKGKIEFIDLVPRKSEREPIVRRDQEQKPQTLASKLVTDGPTKIATTSLPKAQTLQKNSFENILDLRSCTQPMFLTNTLKKYEERNRDTREYLEESQVRAEQYANHKDEAHLERVLRHITITDTEVVLDDIFEDEVPELPTLYPRMQKAIDNALIPNPPHETLVESFSLRITRHDMKTLANLNWLNDEIINFYMNLLIERGKRDTFPSVHAFNTFFYSKLVSTGYATLKRWTRKIDIFSHDLIIVPVHLGVHWCMAAIDFRDKTIKYYDSMGNSNNKCLNALAQYLEEESMDKKKKPFNTSSWKKINVKDNPHQMNGSDCGVFACIYAEYICRNSKITFTQSNMPYFRRKMVYEILSSKLLDFN